MSRKKGLFEIALLRLTLMMDNTIKWKATVKSSLS